MIGLSPLPTAHPTTFQRCAVRASTTFYGRFTLAMDRSPGFASAARYSGALFGLAFATAPPLSGLTSQRTTTPRLIKQKARRHPDQRSGLRLLVGVRFQVLFHSPPGVLFTFPSRYWCTIGHGRVFSLTRWSSQIPTGFLVSRGTWESGAGSPKAFAYGAITLFGATFPCRFG